MAYQQPQTVTKHAPWEDALALLIGTLLVSLGLNVYAKATLLIGSTAGFALLVQYVTGIGFWWIFFVVNLPFYVLGYVTMGWAFTLRTFVAVTLLSVLSKLTGSWMTFERIEPLYAAVVGGVLTGMGLLSLFRHRTGLGGVNILALWIQERWKLKAGYVQLAVDLCIMAAAFFVLSPTHLGLSVLSAVIVNMTVAINHRGDRYLATS